MSKQLDEAMERLRAQHNTGASPHYGPAVRAVIDAYDADRKAPTACAGCRKTVMALRRIKSVAHDAQATAGPDEESHFSTIEAEARAALEGASDGK